MTGCVAVQETLCRPEKETPLSRSEVSHRSSMAVSSEATCPMTTASPIAPPAGKTRNLSDDTLHSYQNQVTVQL